MDLWKHQEQAINRAFTKNYFALFFEMGTGKTRTAIEILRQKNRSSDQKLKTLILCPLVVCPNWVRELRQWGDINACFLEGSQAARLQAFRKALSIQTYVYVLNYEGLLMKDLFLYLSMWGPEFLIFDESHKLKSPSSQRTKRSLELSKTARYRLLLTGTPTLNSLEDLFSQFLILDHGKVFGNNYYAFRNKYFYDKNYRMPSHIRFPKFTLKDGAADEMAKIIREDTMSVTKEECLDLPPLVKEIRYVELGKEQARVYEEMKRDFITTLNDAVVTAPLALTKLLRLQQIVSGFIKSVDGKELEIKDSKRISVLRELLEDAPNQKIIIWAVFRQNYRAISALLKEMKIDYVEVHGEITSKNKQVNIDRFTQDPKCLVYLGHSGSGGIGVNLTISNLAIYFSRDLSLEHNLQSESRNHRGGSEIHSKVTRIDIVAKETVDEIIMERLSKKMEMGERLLSDLKQIWT